MHKFFQQAVERRGDGAGNPDPLWPASPLEVGLCVASLERSLAFYRDALGFDFISRVDTPASSAVRSGFAIGGYTVVRLQLASGERLKLFEPSTLPTRQTTGHPPLSRVGFAYLTLIIVDLAAALARLQQCGISARLPGAFELRPGVRVALIDDPDGNVVELVQYSDLEQYRSDLQKS